MPSPPRIYTNTDKFIWLVTFIFYISGYLIGGGMGTTVMAVCTLLVLLTSNYKFEFTTFHFFVFQFMMFCYATAFWAMGYQYAIDKGNTLFFTFLSMSVFYSYYKKMPGVDKLFEILMWTGYITIIYAVFFVGIGRIAAMDAMSSRTVSGLGNLNSIGMLAATTIIINLYFFMEGKYKRAMFLAIPALAIVAVSQSRKALFTLVFGVIFLYLLKNTRGKKDNLIPILKFTFFLGIIVGILVFLFQTDMFAGTINRWSGFWASLTGDEGVDSSTSKREFMRKIGWIQFSRTPLLGIGMGCARILTMRAMDLDCYLHCNYAELAADGGIIGLVSYYSIFVYLIYHEIKYLKVDNMAVLIITMLIIRLTTDWGMVSYYNKSTYFSLMIYFLHLRWCRMKYPDIR